jgi:hypothetical protein
MTDQQPRFDRTPHAPKRTRQQQEHKARNFAEQVRALVEFYAQRRPKAARQEPTD